MRQHGIVLWYSCIRGYGFLLVDETYEEIFVCGEDDLNKGDRVSFAIVSPGKPGQQRAYQAVSISKYLSM